MNQTTAVVLKGYPRLSETFIAQELRGLERAGHELVLFSMRHPTDRTTHPIHREIAAPVVYLPEYLHAEPLRVLRALAKLAVKASFRTAIAAFVTDFARDPSRNRIRRFGQGCVLAAELPERVTRLYAHFIHTPAAVTRYASLIAGLPWSCSAHAKDIWTSPDWDLAQSLASASWITTCTEIGHRHLRDLSPKPGTVHLVYHGLDLDRFPSPACDRGARDGRRPDTPIRLLSVGRAVEKKGFDTLLDALALLPADLHWTWAHIGGGALLPSLKDQATRLGLAERIQWLGAQDQAAVRDAYRQSDIFILPSRVAADGDRDGLPNVLVEALSQRMAAIATPVSAIPELIADGEHGLLVPPGDPAALATAIARLSHDQTLRTQLGLAGERRVRTAFDYTAGIRALDALFRDHPISPDHEDRPAPSTALPQSVRT